MKASVLQLPATPEDVMRGVEHLAQFCEQAQVPRKIVQGLMLAVEEMASNIVNHAYRGDAQQTFQLTLQHHGDRLVVELRDRGPAFDPLQATPPDLETDPDDRAIGGLGIHLLRHYVNELNYTRESDENVLRMTQRIPLPESLCALAFSSNPPNPPPTMPLDIKIKRQIDELRNIIVTVELGGSLDTATAPELEQQLAATLDDQVKDLIFDLAHLTFISSAGLRVFAATRKYLKQRGEQVSFVNLQPQIREVFEIVKALPGVSVFGSIGEFDNYIATRQKRVIEGE